MNNLRINSKDISKYVILTGDQQRADRIAKKLSDYQMVSCHREFRTYTGYWKGERLSIVSTGIGAPAAAIVTEELHNAGAECLIRIGTSGAVNRNIKLGDIIVATGAYRDEGTSKQYVPSEYPALADYSVINFLVKIAEEKNIDVITGLVHTKDALAMESPQDMPLCIVNSYKWDILEKSNILVTEMESSVIMVLASIFGIKAGAVIVSAGLTYNGEPDVPYELYGEKIDIAIDLVLDTFAEISKKDKMEK